MPLLSIVIPVYNVESYLEDCLESIIRQRFDDYEVILVNDASTDKSGIICDEYAEKYSNINVIHLKENSLLGAARNIGLRNACGEYVHFCDSDDYFIENSFSEIAKELKNNTSDVIIGHFICNPEKGAFVCNDIDLISEKNNIIQPELLKNFLYNNKSFLGTAWRFIIKREFLIENKLDFIEGYVAEDEEWFPRLLCLCEKFREIQEPFYCYRPRKSGSISSKKTYLHSKSQLMASINLIKFLNKYKYEDIRKEFLCSRIKNLLGVFSTRCNTFSKSQIEEISAIIEKNIDEIRSVNRSYLNEQIFDYIFKYGLGNGFLLYIDNVIDKTLEMVKGKENKDIYIFPTGYNGEGTANILMSSNFNVKGFFDNSPIKNGCVIEGLKVSNPSILKELGEDELNNIFIIISTQNKQVVDILKNQLKNFNIKESQLSVRIY